MPFPSTTRSITVGNTLIKGFFPQQDTGLIVSIPEGAENISPRAMKDESAHAGGFDSGDEGPGGPTVTENDGRVFITLICLFPRLTEHAIRWLIGI
jgi:hypothetical protein